MSKKKKDKDNQEAMKKALSPQPPKDKKVVDDTFAKLMQGMLSVPPFKKPKEE